MRAIGEGEGKKIYGYANITQKVNGRRKSKKSMSMGLHGREQKQKRGGRL